MSRRKSSSPSLSLFAFQDIITGVAGVMLFILLLLVVQLAIQKSVRQSSKSESSTTESDSRLIQQSQIANLNSLIERKKLEVEAYKTKIDLILEAKVVDFDEELKVRKDRIAKLQNELVKKQSQVSLLREENEKLRTNNPSKSILEEIEKIKDDIRVAESQIIDWQDETRVNYKTDSLVKNLYLFDVQKMHCTMAVLPFDNRSKRIEFSSKDSADDAADAIQQQYEKLPSSRQDPERRIVILIRPSAASFAAELVRALRKKGFEVAMELLEAKAELFRRRDNKMPK